MYKTENSNQVNIFRSAFQELSVFLQTKLHYEKQANQYNMESGIPLEDYFREEFGGFIPDQYDVTSGKIIDRQNFTCGDCDFIVYDRRYAPFVKFPATEQSRRKLIAFETTYGIIEIKQKLTLGALEDGELKANPTGQLFNACEKIFAYKELNREAVNASNMFPGFTIAGISGDEDQYNKPFGFAFFYDADIDTSQESEIEKLLREFWMINRLVPPSMRVNGIVVLDKFVVSWVKESGIPDPTHLTAFHPENAPEPMFSLIKSGNDTLYLMYALIWNLLLKTHLKSPNFNADYGGTEFLQDFDQVLVRFEKS